MLRALLSGLLAFLLSYALIVAGLVAWAGARATGHNALGDWLASAVLAIATGWMPALVLALLAWATVYVRTRPDGASTLSTAGVVATGAVIVAGLLLPPGRTVVLRRVFGVQRDVSPEPLHTAAPGELGTVLATAHAQAEQVAWLEATARDGVVLARYSGTTDAAAADRAAAAAFAIERLAAPPCTGAPIDAADGMSEALLDRLQCRVLALETLLQVSLSQPDDRVAWLLDQAPDADLLWYRQAGPDRASHLPGLDRLTGAERQTLAAAARQRLDTAAPADTTGPDLFLRAIALQDPAAAAALASGYLR